jgi:hypothetical protein
MPDGARFDARAWHIVERLQERYGIAIRVERVGEIEAAARDGLLIRRHRSRGAGQLVETRAVVCVLAGEGLTLRTVTAATRVPGRGALRYRACKPKRGKQKGRRHNRRGRRPRSREPMEEMS